MRTTTTRPRTSTRASRDRTQKGLLRQIRSEVLEMRSMLQDTREKLSRLLEDAVGGEEIDEVEPELVMSHPQNFFCN